MPSHSDARLEIVLVPPAQPPCRVNDRAEASRKWIDGLRVEGGNSLVGGSVWRLVAVTQAQVQCDGWAELPVILKVEAVDRRAWLPVLQLLVKRSAPHRSGEEAGESVARAWEEVAVSLQPGCHAIEIELPAGTVRLSLIETETQNLVSGLERVGSLDDRQVVPERHRGVN